MRPIAVTLGAAGFSDWVLVDRNKPWFGIGLDAVISSGASLTYSVQFTLDNFRENRTENFSIARVTTTATVTKTGHLLTAADWIALSGTVVAPFIGSRVNQWAVASVVDADNFTFTVANSGATAVALGSGCFIQTARIMPHDTIAAETTSQSGNFAFPPFAYRLAVTSYTSGSVTLTGIQAG